MRYETQNKVRTSARELETPRTMNPERVALSLCALHSWNPSINHHCEPLKNGLSVPTLRNGL
jgi:hypothetical protein